MSDELITIDDDNNDDDDGTSVTSFINCCNSNNNKFDKIHASFYVTQSKNQSYKGKGDLSKVTGNRVS